MFGVIILCELQIVVGSHGGCTNSVKSPLLAHEERLRYVCMDHAPKVASYASHPGRPHASKPSQPPVFGSCSCLALRSTLYFHYLTHSPAFLS